jgi:branched-chain amino acid transport system substrate-binding protein
MLLLVQACTSLRPVVKIGLLAPFEGLHRRTGYAALDAMRMAIAEAPTSAVDVLPLAVDDANDPLRAKRSAQKLMVDPKVQAVIGPLSPGLLFHVTPVLDNGVLLWLAPFAVEGSGFANPRTAETWLGPLVMVVAEEAQKRGCRQLVLAGWSAYQAGGWTTGVALPVVQGEAPAAVQSTDAVLHLGDPDQAAFYLRRLRTHQPNAPFFLGPQGEDPVFAERAQTSEAVSWVTWLDEAYDGWAAQQATASPAAYRVYRATQEILAQLNEERPPAPGVWEPRFFVMNEQGQSRQCSMINGQ